MNIMARVLNFVLGLLAVLLILLGVTSSEEPQRNTMLAVGVGLFILTFLIHWIQQTTQVKSKY